MALTQSTQSPAWFVPEVVGHSFIGDRNRMHVCRVQAQTPTGLLAAPLCGTGEPITTMNPRLDPDDEQACRDWWAEKVRVDPTRKLDSSLAGGLAKPRLCQQCRELYAGEAG